MHTEPAAGTSSWQFTFVLCDTQRSWEPLATMAVDVTGPDVVPDREEMYGFARELLFGHRGAETFQLSLGSYGAIRFHDDADGVTVPCPHCKGTGKRELSGKICVGFGPRRAACTEFATRGAFCDSCNETRERENTRTMMHMAEGFGFREGRYGR